MGQLRCEAQQIPEERQLPRLVDQAELLSDSESQKLEKLLDEVSERQQCDVAVVTVDSFQGKSAQDYADDFYDYNGYGMGAQDDGMLFLIGMETRKWQITTYGFGTKALTDAGIEYLAGQFLPDLKEGNYYEAFRTYASLCDKFLAQARNGDAYDVGNLPKEKLSGIWIPISVGIGFLLALLTAGGMKLQLRSVRSRNSASSYVRPGSRNLRNSRDLFLYQNVTRTQRPQSDNSGGSSMHTSSSGRSHGSGGGSF